MIRFVVLAIVIVPLTAYHGALMVWAVWRNRPDADCRCVASPRAWARALLRLAGVDVVLENPEVIDASRAQILYGNHTSWFDVLALAATLPGGFVFVAKKELESVPVFGRAIGGCGHVFVDRGDRAAAIESLARAKKLLEERSPTIIMFPEGTRSATGELGSFKKGAFVLAIQTGAELVPAAIFGARAVMRKGSYRVRPGTIRVRLGAPVPVHGYDIEKRNELTRTAREALLALQRSGHGAED